MQGNPCAGARLLKSEFFCGQNQAATLVPSEITSFPEQIPHRPTRPRGESPREAKLSLALGARIAFRDKSAE
tara:strand:+ start:102 stop:317 length:216 start_codon:yes stop_codon:yes gene_type:complete